MYLKYKDVPPSETIDHIQKILRDTLKTTAIVSRICFNSSTNYSNRITLEDTDFGTNGKGTTSEYALASGLSELMERLQSQILFTHGDIPMEYKELYGFEYFPDDKKIPLKKILRKTPSLKQDLKDLSKKSDNISMKFFEDRHREDGHSWCSSFYSVKSQKIVYLPSKLISVLNSSNGLAAGNSPAEALVQAFSEIAERYAVSTFFYGKLTPPEISREWIKENHPDSFFLLKDLEDSLGNNYNIHVFDLSLGRGFPVLAILLVDRNLMQYKFSAGAHPVFEIALERCLTEVTQGRDLKGSDRIERGYPSIFENYENLFKYANCKEFLVGYMGIIPYSFFKEKPNWEFHPWKIWDNFSNEKGIAFFLDLFSFASDIYIKDFNFLDFNTYRIYIPGVSTLSDPRLSCKGATQITQEFLRDYQGEEIPKEIINDIIETLEGPHFMKYKLQGPLGLDFYLLALYLQQKRYRDALDFLNKNYINNNKLLILKKELELRDELSEKDRSRYLRFFFPEEDVIEIETIWRSECPLKSLYKILKIKPSPEEKNKDNIYISNLYLRCKNLLKEKYPDSSSLKNLFKKVGNHVF